MVPAVSHGKNLISIALTVSQSRVTAVIRIAQLCEVNHAIAFVPNANLLWMETNLQDALPPETWVSILHDDKYKQVWSS